MAQSLPSERDAVLSRLSQKPGVQSTLVLSRSTGAIVRTTGLISSSSSANPNSTLPASTNTTSSPGRTRSDTTSQGQTLDEASSGVNGAASNESAVNGTSKAMNDAERVASMVWNFMSSAGGLVKGLDEEDEVKLLRLRTKKNELVIVPDPKFLLVVIHDTPPA